ncbi:hypothetical protein MSSD14B_21040 [Marinobacter salsuginis]|uniref:Alginate export domain-containing protein n=2 Tax=Pseudomonadota TaxID=1224 RepID=A0A5M3Q044_9GAMM|nr:hypothetical protein MSSD14B_21040 [Marinobacter salsuginis]
MLTPLSARKDQRNQKSLLALAIGSLMVTSATPALSQTFTEALAGGAVSLDVRYRYEFVDQDNPLDQAHASTVRTRLGYRTDDFRGFEVFAEAEDVSAVGNENYNSTVNGKADHSVVADPTETEVNQIYVRYKGLPDTSLTYGRQRLALDNHRFIGTVGWRQNEQTFDAFIGTNESLKDTKITAGYLYNANRIFSDASSIGNFPMQAPILNVQYQGLAAGTLTAYGYLFDFTTVDANSTQNLGLRFTGGTDVTQGFKVLYTLEYAIQKDYAGNPQSFEAAYWLAEAGLAAYGLTFKVGVETLESDDGRPFQTPLATLHAMNGWADQFLVTPDDGLQDLYVSAGAAVKGVKLLAIFHDYSSDINSLSYGSELGLLAVYPIDKHYTLGAKFASYAEDGRGVDTDKAWLWGEVKF